MSSRPRVPALFDRPDALLGGLSFLHRFGSARNPRFHFHVALAESGGCVSGSRA